MFVDFLKDNNSYLKLFERMAGLGHWVVDLKDNSLFWSEEVYRIHGLSPEIYIPSVEDAVDFYHPEDRCKVENAVGYAMQQGTSFEFELRIIRPDQSIRYVRSKGECEVDKKGCTVAIFGVFEDVTEDKKNSIALNEALEFQSLLMQKNPDYIFVKDKEFRIVEANPAFLSFYPPSKRDKVIGYTTLEDYPQEQAEEFLVEDKKAFVEGSSEKIEKIDFPDGFSRVLLTKKVRFENSEGEPFILGIARDITEIKEVQDDLLQANAELEEFAYRTSHDLRSPLVSSLGILELIEKKLHSGDVETVKNSLGIVKRSIKKLDNLVLDILALTKIKNSDEIDQLIDVREVVSETLENFSQMDGFSEIEFNTDFQCNELIHVKQTRFILIVENLISNAIKYYDPNVEHARVTICLRRVEADIVFSVSDNGLGILPNHHEKLFSMFKRFHPKTSFGSGLGLYMVKKSADILGGVVSYTPLDNGSIFTLTLPFKPRR